MPITITVKLGRPRQNRMNTMVSRVGVTHFHSVGVSETENFGRGETKTDLYRR